MVFCFDLVSPLVNDLGFKMQNPNTAKLKDSAGSSENPVGALCCSSLVQVLPSGKVSLAAPAEVVLAEALGDSWLSCARSVPGRTFL